MTDEQLPPRPAVDEPADGATGMPVSVRVAVGLLAVLAALLLLSAALTWFGREGVVDRFLAAQPELQRADVTRFVVFGLLRDLVLGVVGASAAWGLTRRAGWARWAGLAVVAFLGLLSLLLTVSAGGASALSLLLLVLCAGAAASLLAGTTRTWLPMRSRGRS